MSGDAIFISSTGPGCSFALASLYRMNDFDRGADRYQIYLRCGSLVSSSVTRENVKVKNDSISSDSSS